MNCWAHSWSFYYLEHTMNYFTYLRSIWWNYPGCWSFRQRHSFLVYILTVTKICQYYLVFLSLIYFCSLSLNLWQRGWNMFRCKYKGCFDFCLRMCFSQGFCQFCRLSVRLFTIPSLPFCQFTNNSKYKFKSLFLFAATTVIIMIESAINIMLKCKFEDFIL